MSCEDQTNDIDESCCLENAYVNQLTLNFLISKTQLQKLNKLKQKEIISEPKYDKKRIHQLFNQLLDNERPDDLLEDVKTCFDAFIEKSIYYLDIHDKNEIIQNERTNNVEEDGIKEDINFQYEEDMNDDINFEEENNEQDDEDDQEYENINEEYFEEPKKPIPNKKNLYAKPHPKYSKNSKSIGVENIQKLPLDWFNTTRKNYEINKIIPRKKEVIIYNSCLKK